MINSKNIIKNIISFKIIIINIFLKLLIFMVGVTISKLMRKIVDATNKVNFNTILHYSIILIIGVVIASILTCCFGIIKDKINFLLVKEYKFKLYDKLYQNNISDLESLQVGEIKERISDDSMTLYNCININSPSMITNIICCLGYLIYIATYNIWISLIIFAIGLLQIIPEISFKNYTEKCYTGTRNIEETITNYTLNGYRGLLSMKSYNLKKMYFDLLGKLHKRYLKIGVNGEIVSQIGGVLDDFIYTLSNYGTYIIIGLFVFYNFISIGTATEIIVLISTLYTGIAGIFSFITDYYEARKASERLQIFFKITKVYNKFEGKDYKNILEFRNVSLKKNNFIIKDLSFKIPENSKVLVVGNNGIGKSTIFKLFCKFYDNYKGEILYKSTNIKNIQDKDLYSNISYLNQNDKPIKISPILIFKSLKKSNNISREEVNYLLEILNIDKSLLTKQTFAELSGGEKRKIYLALALLKQSNLLILDEPTNYLDQKTKNNLSKYLKSIDKTMIIISHEIEFFDYCDYILKITTNNCELIKVEKNINQVI